MADAAVVDIIDGNRGRRTLKDGWEFDRIAIVKGLSTVGVMKLYEASQAPGMPQVGYQHPVIPSCILRDMELDSESSDTARILLHYSEGTQDESPQIPLNAVSGGASVAQVETNKDYNGDDVAVHYTFPTDYKWKDFSAVPLEIDRTDSASPLVSRLVPQLTISITREETIPPIDIAKEYVGKVNDGGWTLDNNAAERTWLCTGIEFRNNNVNEPYQVTYSFQYRSDTWDAEFLYIDPNTGKPPEDLIEDFGRKTVQWYETINFNNLRLGL